MVRAAYAEIDPNAPGVGLMNLILLSPFVVGAETLYELLFVPFGDSFRVELRSKQAYGKQEWTSNFKAEVRTLERPATLTPELLEKSEALQ